MQFAVNILGCITINPSLISPGAVDCKTKTSSSRTDSPIVTDVSLLLYSSQELYVQRQISMNIHNAQIMKYVQDRIRKFGALPVLYSHHTRNLPFVNTTKIFQRSSPDLPRYPICKSRISVMSRPFHCKIYPPLRNKCSQFYDMSTLLNIKLERSAYLDGCFQSTVVALAIKTNNSSTNPRTSFIEFAAISDI